MLVFIPVNYVFADSAAEHRARAEQLRREAAQMQQRNQPQSRQTQSQAMTVEDRMADMTSKAIGGMFEELFSPPKILSPSEYDAKMRQEEIERNILREQNQRKIDQAFPPRRR